MALLPCESTFIVYTLEGERMEFCRRLFIKHELGEQITAERVREAMQAEVWDFCAAKYRVIPADRWFDIEVKATVFIS